MGATLYIASTGCIVNTGSRSALNSSRRQYKVHRYCSVVLLGHGCASAARARPTKSLLLPPGTRCPYGARTVPVQCPMQCPYGARCGFCNTSCKNMSGEQQQYKYIEFVGNSNRGCTCKTFCVIYTSGTVRALHWAPYGHRTGTVCLVETREKKEPLG